MDGHDQPQDNGCLTPYTDYVDFKEEEKRQNLKKKNSKKQLSGKEIFMAQGRKTRQKQQADLKGSVSGWHVYKDERGRAVYYDVFSKNGYILANNEDRYKQFSMRFVMGAIGFILMLMFDMPIWLCVLAGVGVYGFLEFRFRRFLKNLARVENFKCNEK